MRKAEVILKSTICGKVRQVDRIRGDFPTIIDKVRRLAPRTTNQEIKDALNQSLWTDNLCWIGGHTLAIQILSIDLPDSEIPETSKHLEEQNDQD